MGELYESEDKRNCTNIQCGTYLEECIHSVLNQTLRDIELLLIDDGSTDGSFRICEEYSKRITESGVP